MTSPSRPRSGKLRALTGATVLTAGIIAAIPAAAQATPVACSENALVAAIDTANTTPAPDTLNLASGCTYGLTSSHGSGANGPAGLPVITTPIEMIGPATITRTTGILRPFRIAEVSTTGNLTLTTAVTLSNGRAASLLGLFGRDGGGILNRGAVTLTKSSLTNNFAEGTGGGLSNADTPTGTAPAATFTESPVSSNTAGGRGGGVYSGRRATLTMTGAGQFTPTPVNNNRSTGQQGGGIAAINSTATTLTNIAVTTNRATGAGGVFRLGGTMTTTTSPITANIPNNCVGSVPAVPNCTA
ncbi:MAG TPA: hypothetical protein VGO81_17520 [Solirubrobacteraceae bacterium]|nr:hypothetical protein [Solirubrobacteraceae bacterium]